jgi:hypothetical protein
LLGLNNGSLKFEFNPIFGRQLKGFFLAILVDSEGIDKIFRFDDGIDIDIEGIALDSCFGRESEILDLFGDGSLGRRRVTCAYY